MKKTCLHCGYTWQPRIETEPKACPRCKSPRWDEELRRAGRPRGKREECFGQQITTNTSQGIERIK
jgi:hypothetical protein